MTGHHAHLRFLPHFQNDHRTYFLTFCTAKRAILTPQARDCVMHVVLELSRDELEVHACVVMPDHVHLLLTPLWNGAGEVLSVAEIVRKVKGHSARLINLAGGKTGSVWQREYFDRELRSDEAIRKKGEYIVANPVRAGLVDSPDDYPWLWRSWVEGTKSTG